MTWDRLEALEKEWRLRPPVHLLVAGFLGYKPPADDLINPVDAEEGRRMLAQIQMMPPPTLDLPAKRVILSG